MAHLRPVYLIPVVGFLVLAAIFGRNLYTVGVDGRQASDLPSALIDKAAPQFALPAIAGGGKGFSRADLAGGVSLVNVWASWCPPCRIEHPVLMRLARQGVTIWGINYKDKPADALRFLADLGNPYSRIGADGTGRVSIDWGVYGYPETFVIDRAGRIRYKHIGPIMPRDLANTIGPILERLRQ
jgi:cytochrome c biogenesis protein CcmG/thiol:disulfide interchange protein DsbE